MPRTRDILGEVPVIFGVGPARCWRSGMSPLSLLMRMGGLAMLLLNGLGRRGLSKQRMPQELSFTPVLLIIAFMWPIP
eukprot:6288326-Pyramimonas_sp.AAC.1